MIRLGKVVVCPRVDIMVGCARFKVKIRKLLGDLVGSYKLVFVSFAGARHRIGFLLPINLATFL